MEQKLYFRLALYAASAVLWGVGWYIWPANIALVAIWALSLLWYTRDIDLAIQDSQCRKTERSVYLLFTTAFLLSLVSMFLTEFPRSAINVIVGCILLNLIGLIYFVRTVTSNVPFGLYLYTAWIFGLLLIRPNIRSD